MLAVIGGSGLSRLANLEVRQRKAARTPFGEPSGPLTVGSLADREIVFLARHGYGHTIAPHQINYRANLWALKDLGVERVVSIASVGGIRADLVPGVLLVPDQILDYTWGRAVTFFEGAEAEVCPICLSAELTLSLLFDKLQQFLYLLFPEHLSTGNDIV